MQFRKLGQGLEVSALGLGCMPMIGSASGAMVYGVADEAEAVATIQRAIDLGVTFFDTAEAYGPYRNEEQIGRAIKGRREGLVLATKFAFKIVDGKVTGEIDGSPAHARAACEGALQRFGVDVIDLFYLHRVDPAVPIEESVGGMAELVREGKVRHLGLSEAGAATIRRAHATHPIAALQSEYSLWEREVEIDILPVTRDLGIGFVPFSPLGRGFLTGDAPAPGQLAAGDSRSIDPRYGEANYEANLGIVAAIKSVAARYDVSPARVALAWLLTRGADIVPIPGAKRRTTMEDSMAAADLVLPPHDIRVLDAAAPVGTTAGERYSPAAMKLVRI
jgi:aryl-alcohol dehydrogenase-like predicted oxidoreductase